MSFNADFPYLCDGVDIYFDEVTYEVTFVFLSTRQRIVVRTKQEFVPMLAQFDGTKSIDNIIDQFADLDRIKAKKFIEYLTELGVITTNNWFDQLDFSNSYKSRIRKQLYFLKEFLANPNEVYRVQKTIKNTRICLIGLGSVGSWIMIEMLQMGFEIFTLIDHDIIQESDVTRHAYFDKTYCGQSKAEYYKNFAESYSENIQVTAIQSQLDTDTKIEQFMNNIDLIINSADEPYIGYTSISLSRFAIKKKIPLFVAGGFDAHLGSLGELIIPGSTPCSDCYNTYFKDALKNWKPILHPVKDRSRGMGGLISMNIFSSSSALLSLLKYFIDPESMAKGGRGEFKFSDYSIDYFEVNRDLNCKVCKNV